MINISAIHAKAARGFARYLLDGTISEENPLDLYAREVAAGEMTFSEAADELIHRAIKAGANLDRFDDIQDRIMDRLADAVVAIQEAELIKYRTDMPPRIDTLLRLDGATVPTGRVVANLIEGRDAKGRPIEGKRYAVGRLNHEPVTALSLTFSAAKGPSIIHGLAEGEQRREIQRAHQAAVETTLHQIEPSIAVARVGRGGEGGRERGELGWVSFFHDDSRWGDPHMHSHVAIMNVVASQESDRIGSIYYRGYHGLNTHFRGVFQAELAQNLSNRGWDAWFAPQRIECMVRNIPDAVLEAFSTRRNEALAAVEAASLARGRHLLDLAVRERLALINRAIGDKRPRKGEHKPDREEWKRRARSLGWNAELRSWARRGEDLNWHSTLRI